MRLYREFSTYDKNGNRTPVDPTSVSAVTKTLGGTTIETFSSPMKDATGRYYVETDDSKYTDGTVYQIAWTATIGGDEFTRTVRFEHQSPSGADTTPPGAPTLTWDHEDRTSTSLTFGHTPPDDADYDHTEVYAFALEGGEDGSATGSGDTITVSGLTPAQPYLVAAVAYDAAGNRSEPFVLPAVCLTMTPGQDDIAVPMTVRWYPDSDDTEASRSPWKIDPTQAETRGKMRSLRVPLRTGQLRSLRVRAECDGPVPQFCVLQLALTYMTRPTLPHGRPRE